jgi:hypothetical protein
LCNSVSQKINLYKFNNIKERNDYGLINLKRINESKTNDSLTSNSKNNEYHSNKLLITSLNNNKNNEYNSNKLLITTLNNNNYDANFPNYFSFGNTKSNGFNSIYDMKRKLKKSYSTRDSTNIKFKNIKTAYSEFLPNDSPTKLLLKNLSNKSLQNQENIKTLPMVEKDSFISMHSNKNNFFLTSNIEEIESNKTNNENNNSSLMSQSKNTSNLNEIKAPVRLDSSDKNKDIPFPLKKNKKLFKLMITNKMNELETQLKKDILENNNNNKVNNLIINYMIKKCKRILKKVDDKMNFEIFTFINEFDKNEVNLNFSEKKSNYLSYIVKRMENMKKDKLEHEKLFARIKNNTHKVYNLIEKNDIKEQRIKDVLDKLIEKSKL